MNNKINPLNKGMFPNEFTGEFKNPDSGITVYSYIAIKAMQSLIIANAIENKSLDEETIIEKSLLYADLMTEILDSENNLQLNQY